MAVANDLSQRPDLLRLIPRIHRQVRMIPVTEHAQALEVVALRVNLRARECAAGGAKTHGVELLARLAVFLFHGQLDWQAVAVPTRTVRGGAAGRRACL